MEKYPRRTQWVGFEHIKEGLLLATVGLSLIATVVGCQSVGAFTSSEQNYLDALNNPCQHPEVFDNPQSAGCSFTWKSSSSQLVKEGHRICDLEGNKPPGNDYGLVHDYVASQHPDYSRTQINTQLIAAERLLC